MPVASETAPLFFNFFSPTLQSDLIQRLLVSFFSATIHGDAKTGQDTIDAQKLKHPSSRQSRGHRRRSRFGFETLVIFFAGSGSQSTRRNHGLNLR
ncbi:unnamed protein product [Taenia asiatica]|uniref:Secreted protein n=1 Tax=Taenia asiatica TaxID=60517 RepID=A0A0R3W4F9_TAEAS|nr:unnamed protein product [Taenia asiatica]